MSSDRKRGRLEGRAGQGAALAGIAGAGYLAARVRSVMKDLSTPESPFQWKPERGHSVFLKGANLLDVKRGQILKERGILFSDGQIREIVATRDLDKVSADRTFDCGGLFVIPGLINCHVHATMPGTALLGFDVALSLKRQAVRNLEECPIHGVTTVRDAGGCSQILNNLSQAVERFELLGPRVVGCGASLKPRGGYPEFSHQLPPFLSRKIGDASLYVDSPESGRLAVQQAIDQGARFIKMFFDDRSLFFGHKPLPILDDDSVRAIVDEAHRLGRRVAVHQSQLEGFRRAARLGVDDFEHVPIDAFLESSDIESFMAGDHNLTPTISVGMALGIARRGHPALSDPVVNAMQAERDQVLGQMAPAFCEPAVQRANSKMVELYLDGKADVARLSKSLFDPEPYINSFGKKNPNINSLYKAGARICCGNDGGVPLSWPGMLSVEMKLMERFEMSRIDILRAATINAARLLDMESELGSIEPGKHADLVLLSADPTKDIRAVERIEAVFRSGALLHSGGAFKRSDAGGR